MQYFWRVVEKTLSMLVREICYDTYQEYVDDVTTGAVITWRMETTGWWFPEEVELSKLCWCHWWQTYSHQKTCHLLFLIWWLYRILQHHLNRHFRLRLLVGVEWTRWWVCLHNVAFDITLCSFIAILKTFILTIPYPFVFAGYGSCWDARIYNISEFLETVQDGSIGFPDPHPFPNDNVGMAFFLLGDDALSLSENMQKYHAHRVLTREKRILNYLLSKS